MKPRRVNTASEELRRLATADCRVCCQPKGHRGEHCVLCLERRQPEPYRRKVYRKLEDRWSEVVEFLS